MERNVTLDFVRGVAVLGILLLNIQRLWATKGGLSQSTVRRYYATGCMDWAFLDLIGGEIPHAFALLFGAGLQMLLPVADVMDPVAVNAVSLAGLYSRFIVLGRRYSAGLRAGGLNLLAAGARCAIGKSLFNTGVMLYLVGLGVLLLLGLISDSQTSRARHPDASSILYEKHWKLHGGVEAISNRADGVGNSLLALGASMAGNWQG